MVVNVPSIKLCRVSTCAAIATSHDGHCRECFRKSTRERIRPYSDRPMPTPRNGDPVGIELELVNEQGRTALAHLARFVCEDGSLPDCGAEVKLLAHSSRAGAVLADLCTRARHSGARPDRKCGLHVHLSRATIFSGTGVTDEYSQRARLRAAAASFASKTQDWFFDLMPPSRRENIYCKKVGESTPASHYCWLSCSERVPTLEVRLHPSTTNPFKALAWMEVCMSIGRAVANEVRSQLGQETSIRIDNAEDFRDCLPSLALSYVQARERSSTLTKFII